MTNRPSDLRWETVSPFMLLTLRTLMTHPQLRDFQLAGGMSIALLTGHRQSINLDLFTIKPISWATTDVVMAPLFPAGRVRSPISLTYQVPVPSGDEVSLNDFYKVIKHGLTNWFIVDRRIYRFYPRGHFTERFQAGKRANC